MSQPARPTASPSPTGSSQRRAPNDLETIVQRHLKFGWWSLLFFLSLGIVLEALHGFKVGAYLNVSNSTRRLMWTLSHAHGTLLGLVHVAFAFTARILPDWNPGIRTISSTCLCGSSLLIPLGFLLGGLFIYAGDPGLGILLVPLGALLLFTAVLLTGLAVRQNNVDPTPPGPRKR